MPTRLAFVLLPALLVFVSACSGTRAPDDATSDEPELAPAPWSAPALSAIEVPPAYREAWEEAENAASCVLIAPAFLGEGSGASARTAQFAGGWGVAYDLSELRSAFGVAGTGIEPSDDMYADWPHVKYWADGSVAEYGPEGGTGPNQLAYLQIAGESCLYNVWSRLGIGHLEFLLEQLRFVTVDG